MAHFMQQQPFDLEIWHNPLNGPFIVLSVLVSEGVDHLGLRIFCVNAWSLWKSWEVCAKWRYHWDRSESLPRHPRTSGKQNTGSALPSYTEIRYLKIIGFET